MKKKFTGILVCLLMLCMSLFAGCNLIETDNNKLYNAVVAEIYNKENNSKVAEITNRDLISRYETYGAQLVQYQGKTKAEALKMTLKDLENRKITTFTVEENYGINKEGKGLKDIEKAYLWEETYNALQENLNYFYNQIVDSKNEENPQNDNKVFNVYVKNSKLSYDDNENLYVAEINKKDGLIDSYRPKGGVYRDFNDKEDRAKIYSDLVDSLFNDDYKEAYERYYNNLISTEYGMKLSKVSKEVFEREIERLYETNYENFLVQKYSEDLINTKLLPTQDISSDASHITAQDILALYSSKVRTDYTKYVLEENSEYDTDVSKTLKDIYYFKNDEDSTSYFTVANILFQFDEKTEQVEYNKLKAQLDANKGGDGYDSITTKIEDLYNNLEPVIRQYNSISGEYEVVDNESNLSVDDIIYDKIQIELDVAKSTGDANIIGDTINDLIYRYNEDPGMFNAEMPYVIGVDSKGEAVSSFVKEFNDAGLKLYKNGDAQIGDFEIAKTQFGIHVLVYTGKCENLFDGINHSFDLAQKTYVEDKNTKNAIEVLYTKRPNILVDKTYFDVLYDELYTDNSSYLQSANINFLRENYDIKVYNGRIADTLKD